MVGSLQKQYKTIKVIILVASFFGLYIKSHDETIQMTKTQLFTTILGHLMKNAIVIVRNNSTECSRAFQTPNINVHNHGNKL